MNKYLMDERTKHPKKSDDDDDGNDGIDGIDDNHTSRILYLGDFASAITVKRAIIPFFWLASTAIFNTLYVASHLVIRSDNNDNNDNNNDILFSLRFHSNHFIRVCEKS